MQNLVESWKQSGLTQRAFCALKNANYEKLKYWSRKNKDLDINTKSKVDINQPQNISDFIPIDVHNTPTDDFTEFQLTYPNQVKLTCPSGTNLTTLKSLIKLF
jgi:hypothetical protein